MFSRYSSGGIQRIAGFIVLGIFLCSLLGSLFAMVANAEAGSMSSHCIFTTDSQVLCAMDVQDHITAWQSTFLSIIPALFTLLFVTLVGIFAGVVAWRFPFLSVVPLLQTIELAPLKDIQERCYEWFYRPLQELCSRGIIHPILYG